MADKITLNQELAKKARQSVGLTQRKFAQLVGVHYTTIANWEGGNKPPQGAAITLLKVINIHPKLCLETLQDKLN